MRHATDKNRKRAQKFADAWLGKRGWLGRLESTTANGGKLRDGAAVEHETGKSVENARKMANAKYMHGAVRLYLELQENPATRNEAGRDLSRLNQIVKIIASDPGHLQEYDGNLNGMSFEDLDRKFATAVAGELKKDMEEVGSMSYVRNAQYDIVRISDFDEASRYGRYVSWCVTHGKSAWDSYTHGGTGLFYFCLHKGFESVPEIRGEGCPMDDYGKSMIAISVNDDGSLNTCTCRWNHDNGGSDNLMDTRQISDFFGVNFYETFRPRDVEEIMAVYEKDRLPDDSISRMLGAMKVICIGGYNFSDYVKVVDGRVRKYRLVGDGLLFDTYDMEFVRTGEPLGSIYDHAFQGLSQPRRIEIPDGVTSIEEHAFLGCSGLTSVTIPASVTSIRGHAFSGCSGLTSVTIPNSVTSIGYAAFGDCSGLTSVKLPRRFYGRVSDMGLKPEICRFY